MVVGAGIGGMQASLDLAESGFKVYLVERDTAIGGRMAQLDKTFPTNDCAMCIMSPKLIEVGRHPNIEILTSTEVLNVDGEAGHFDVKLQRHPRFVDLARCTGCGECVKVCPIEVPNEYNMGMDGRRAIRKRYPQAIPGGYSVEKRGTAPCRDACPSHVRAQGYVALIAQGRFEEALKVVRRDLPFPAVCGRVCPHPCEDACNRGEVDEPIAIRDLKRFISDYEMKSGKKALPEVGEATGKRIAIVGGGPAGLSAAWFLRLKGHDAVVYESAPKAGGMLRYGIPDYRLPQDVLDREIETFTDLGVEIRCNSAIGQDLKLSDLYKDYDALFVAGGAQKGRLIDIPGIDGVGVMAGVDYLRGSALGELPAIGKRVVVIGGGDVAYDVARTSLRQNDGVDGAETHLCCLESRDEMMASADEIIEGEQEGVQRHNSLGPAEVLKDADGNVTGVAFKACTRVFDEDHRFSPQYDEEQRTVIECDTVILAIGQQADTRFVEGSGLDDIAARGWLQGDPLTCETPVQGIFAGGDMFAGPSIAIRAIAHGKEAAESIDRYLNNRDLKADREWDRPIADRPKKRVAKAPRQHPALRDVAERKGDYAELGDGLTEEQAVTEAQRCLACGICSECGLCEEACQAKAIDHDMKGYEQTLSVGSVILSPGFDQFEADQLGEYGHGRWANVVTSLEFERFLSATGPTVGHVKRPSDNKEPKKVAWIQCVGSRDERHDRKYCSGVCCMFATKEAVIATDHSHGELSTTIFMMDLRAMGKGFDDYCNRAQSQYGVRYVRATISRVDEVPGSSDIQVTYVGEDGQPVKETFDMLVLSTGLKPQKDVKELARRVGIELDVYGFAKNSPYAPLATSRPGVFVCGVMQGPKDIPETVAQASGAAAFAMRDLAPARGTETIQPEMPAEIDTESGDQRIGVFVCNCGINIGSVVDVPDVAEYAKKHGDVVHSEGVLFACSQDNAVHMKEIIKEKGINRLVVASCTPRTHEPLFQGTLKEVGVNPYLFSMANIREQCSWVHAQEPEKATEKAKMMVDMAVANARELKPLHKRSQSVVQSALVIGGGLAGMTAATELATQGFPVVLIEKSDRLGGNLNRLRATHDGQDIKGFNESLIKMVNENPLITVYLNANLIRTTGFLGNFESTIEIGQNGEKRREVYEHGATIVATGGHESTPKEYAYGESPAIITQMDMEEKLADPATDFAAMKDIVMIQCVGSRNEERPYCSRVCCAQALKNALAIKERAPKANVTVLMREMRSYGLKEDLYNKARRLGVLFMRYDVENPPLVKPSDKGATVTIDLPRMGKVDIEADLVALAAAIEPNNTDDVATILKLPRTADNYFLEVHQKLRPVDFASDGIFMAGLAHGPKPVDETIAQAAAAAARASSVLSSNEMMVGGQVSVVDPDKCARCMCCARACPYGVPKLVDGYAFIEPAECQGCGVCASECPGKAIQLQHVTNNQISAMLTMLNNEETTRG